MIWCVIWVVLMILWLFGTGAVAYQGPNPPNMVTFGVGTLIPWACVLILGLFVFQAVSYTPMR